jgi:hypothetical protein
MQELVHDVEGHLDGDGLASVMRTCQKHSWSLLGGLRASLQSEQGNIATFVRFAERGDLDVVGELSAQLVDSDESVVVAVVVT